MIDYKGRVESYSREMLRKESQIKELQTRVETGDGCKYQNINFLLLTHVFLKGFFKKISSQFSFLSIKK